MTPFTYLEPGTLATAVSLLGEHGSAARVLAGGQSLNLALKDRSVRPRFVVSLARIAELRGIRGAVDGRLEIGATATYAEAGGGRFAGWHAEIAATCLNLADRSVRNMGTLGGAACQADPRFDVPTLLVGLDAGLAIEGSHGHRTVSAAEFFLPGGGTALGPGEILTTIVIPPLERFTAVAFEKFRYRVFDAAIVNVCCAVRFGERGAVAEARIAVGAVHRSPVLANGAAAVLAAEPLSELSIATAAARATDEVLPLSGGETRLQRYQTELIHTLVRRGLTRIASRD